MKRIITKHDRFQPGAGHSTQVAARGTALRSGYSLVELISAMIVLGIVFTISISILATTAKQRIATEQRQFALQYAATLLERATIKEWAGLTEGPQEIPPATDDAKAMLPGLEANVHVKELTDDGNAKLVAVTVRWTGRAGQVNAPVQLTAWVFPRKGGAT